jgi:membrane fusion protein (multidrug efflux system)
LLRQRLFYSNFIEAMKYSLINTLALTGIALLFFQCGGKKAESNKPKGPAGPPTVEAVVAKPQSAGEVISVNGSLLPNESVEIRPEVSGRITGIFFEEGSAVSKGQLLIQLNNDDLKAQYAKLEINEQLYIDEVNRQKRLLEIKGISQEEYDVSANKLNSVRADKQVLQVAIEKTSIRAPFSGRVGLRLVSPGSYVTSTTLITTLDQTDLLKLEFSIPEKYVASVHKNDVVSFTVTGSAVTHKATIYAMEPSINANSRDLKVRAKTNNTSRNLVPGSYASTEINVNSNKGNLVITTDALIPGMQSQSVFVYHNGLARKKKVQTGSRSSSDIEITEGIDIGDTIIVTGLMQMKDSSAVKIKVRP